MWYHFCWSDSPRIQIKRQITPIWLHTIHNPQGWIAICTDPTGKHMCQPFPLLTPKKGKPKTQTFQKAQMHKAPLIKLPRVFICLGPAWPFFGENWPTEVDAVDWSKTISQHLHKAGKVPYLPFCRFSWVVGSSILIIVEHDCKWSSTCDTGTPKKQLADGIPINCCCFGNASFKHCSSNPFHLGANNCSQDRGTGALICFVSSEACLFARACLLSRWLMW